MPEQQQNLYLHTGDSLSFQSNYASSSRLSSPIGTGRTLSFACLRIGDWLEQLLLKIAHRRGLGANVVYDHLSTYIQELLDSDCIWKTLGSAWTNDVRGDYIWHEFQKLLKYAGYVFDTSVLLALNVLTFADQSLYQRNILHYNRSFKSSRAILALSNG